MKRPRKLARSELPGRGTTRHRPFIIHEEEDEPPFWYLGTEDFPGCCAINCIFAFDDYEVEHRQFKSEEEAKRLLPKLFGAKRPTQKTILSRRRALSQHYFFVNVKTIAENLKDNIHPGMNLVALTRGQLNGELPLAQMLHDNGFSPLTPFFKNPNTGNDVMIFSCYRNF